MIRFRSTVCKEINRTKFHNFCFRMIIAPLHLTKKEQFKWHYLMIHIFLNIAVLIFYITVIRKTMVLEVSGEQNKIGFNL